MEYKKDFDKWNIEKQSVQKRQRVYFKEREIWWVHIGLNVGIEQDGNLKFYSRPVLIYKKINNISFVCLPLTHTLSHDSANFAIYFNDDLHTVRIAQIRVLDSKRLDEKIGTISEVLFSKIKNTVTAYLA
ncbi:MAG: type II toxin-antitoxin system PemK/MazF family toxin [Candidatus Pacebacteria bacterium]|jgi:mRNA-degrading endonuclease toxin of MazEF toxin-antitoxin module|nr:type II toxin-antitoxin system PemK/MazF family toxin [Candidatus Paceibacterota bacterium]